jgi:hypothetical protein
MGVSLSDDCCLEGFVLLQMAVSEVIEVAVGGGCHAVVNVDVGLGGG